MKFICVYFTSCRKVYVFLQKTVAMLARGNPELGLKLYFQIANSADRCALAANMSGSKEGPEFSAVTYEIMAQAFLLYEDEVSDSKAQQRGIVGMVGTLLACRTLELDDYEALITKTAQYAAKLLKKSDQCKMVTLCSHLFFTGEEDVSLPCCTEKGPYFILAPKCILDLLNTHLFNTPSLIFSYMYVF